jgi:hypothetical protein
MLVLSFTELRRRSAADLGNSRRDMVMPRTRVDFRSLTLFEDEESGSTHMAMYATVRDNNGATIAQFKWNNANNEVNETNTYPVNNDPSNISTVDFELDAAGSITVEGYADDDQDWPTAGSNENALGNATIAFDPRVPATLGSWIIGPTQTDNGNTGYRPIRRGQSNSRQRPPQIREPRTV